MEQIFSEITSSSDSSIGNHKTVALDITSTSKGKGIPHLLRQERLILV